MTKEECEIETSKAIMEMRNCIADLEKENAELKAYNEKLLDGDIEKHNKIVELQKRNGELAGQNASLNRWLGEAITFIKDYMIITIGDHTTVCSVPEENRCINVLKLNERAKSFLKEFE